MDPGLHGIRDDGGEDDLWTQAGWTIGKQGKAKTIMSNEFQTRFNSAKVLFTDINAWRECKHGPCQEKEACLGGPRGTCSRTGGWPLCSEEGSRRLKMTGPRETWKRTEEYEKSSPVLDRNRNMEQMLRDMEQLTILMHKIR